MLLGTTSLAFARLAITSATSGSIGVDPLHFRPLRAKTLRIPDFGRRHVLPNTALSPTAGPSCSTRQIKNSFTLARCKVSRQPVSTSRFRLDRLRPLAAKKCGKGGGHKSSTTWILMSLFDTSVLCFCPVIEGGWMHGTHENTTEHYSENIDMGSSALLHFLVATVPQSYISVPRPP